MTSSYPHLWLRVSRSSSRPVPCRARRTAVGSSHVLGGLLAGKVWTLQKIGELLDTTGAGCFCWHLWRVSRGRWGKSKHVSDWLVAFQHFDKYMEKPVDGIGYGVFLDNPACSKGRVQVSYWSCFLGQGVSPSLYLIFWVRDNWRVGPQGRE